MPERARRRRNAPLQPRREVLGWIPGTAGALKEISILLRLPAVRGADLQMQRQRTLRPISSRVHKVEEKVVKAREKIECCG